MKSCPKCGKEFDDTRLLCSVDGEELVAVKSDRGHSRDLFVGVTIDGKYKLERRIGRGGMGAVYAARHTKFNKQVAVKILSRDIMAEEPTSFERFQREAEASARIKHPNAVQVTDFGQTEEGIIYLVMEYVDGPTLRRLLDHERRLAPERTVDLGRQICAAIAAAHRAGIVHRDLKPDNVMIETVDGREIARVLDFGIAKLWDTQQQRRITETGNVLGTPHYMSPEQCRGDLVDHRSDIYALGVTLYEMLSGQLPFDAPTAPAIIVQQATKDPKPLNELCPDLPEPLARVVMRALEKQPNRRQQTAADLADQLEAALEISATPHAVPHKAPPSEASQWRVVFLGLLDSSEEGRSRLLEGLQRSFGLSAAKAEELLKSRPASVKKTASQAEANKVAEKLRAIGADIKVEPIVESTAAQPKPAISTTPPIASNSARVGRKTSLMPGTQKISELAPFDEQEKGQDDTPTLVSPAKPAKIEESTAKFGDLNSDDVPLDPLLMTDGSEMLSYITDRAKLSAETQSRSTSGMLAEQGMTIGSEIEDAARPTSEIGGAGLTQQVGAQITSAADWSVDVSGMIYDHMSEDDVEALIRTSRVRPTHKARKGAGNWYDIGTIPQFRRIFKEINPQIFEPLTAIEVEAKREEEEHAGSLFLRRMLKFCGVCIALYLLIGFGMQYSQRRLLEDDLRVILMDSKTTVITLRDRVRTAIKHRGLTVPDANIHISADPPNKRVSIRVDYNRTLLGIPLHYQAKREISNFDLPLEQLAGVPDGDVELVGISLEDVVRYRQEQAAKRAQEKIVNYQGEPETLKEGAELTAELRECEESLPLFDITSTDEEGRQSYSKSVKIRDVEYTKEAMISHIKELKSKLVDVERLLQEQRNKKLEAESRADK